MSNDDYLDSLGGIKDNIYSGIKNKRSNSGVDCCKEYKFIKKFQTISFNNKMNWRKITHLVLDEEYNQTDILMHDITKPVKYGAPINIGIFGYTRAGKSEAAQLIYFLNKQANKKYKKRDVELYLCWVQADLYLALKKIRKGDVVWNDEQPRTIGEGRLKEKWAVDNVLHVIAKRENCFIFVTPKIDNIKSDICDLYLETAGQNHKTKINRFMILDDERRYMGHVYLKLHNNQEFRDWYEKQKDIFIDDISKNPKVKAVKDKEELTQEEIDELNYIPTDLESIDYVKLCIREAPGNELTIKRYSGIIEKSEKVASRILNNFAKYKKIKSKKVGKSHKFVYYI